jgi:phage terminase large subunit-like protein
MDRPALEKLLATRRQLEQIGEEYPLATARLWVPHCHRWDGLGSKSKRPKGCGKPMQHQSPNVWACHACGVIEPRTSQRELFLRMGSEATLVSGGNRSGKTEAGAMLCVATAAGSGEWWVKEWLQANDLPIDLVPSHPSRVWASSLSYGDGLEYLRPKLDKYLPIGTKRTRWNSQDRALATLPNGGVIVQMSSDSGREKYQGSSIALAWLDEEHPHPIYQECMLRTVDSGGRLFLSMSPLKGMSWVYSEFVEHGDRDGYEVHGISGLDNPWLSSPKLRKSVQHMSEASRAARLYGTFGAQEGLVYSAFSPEIHIVDNFDPPAHWDRFQAIDFGVSHPFCCLWLAWEQDNGRDCLHVYRELYRTEKTTIENGREILRMSKNDPAVRWTVADPESKDGRLILARELGIGSKPAPKHIGLLETIGFVMERLQLDAEGYPLLKVHRSCRNLIREFRLYRWEAKGRRDRPKKSNDHALDALRYQVAILKRYTMR